MIIVAGGTVIRTAVVSADRLESHQAFLTSHPSVVRSEIMADVGRAAARGEDPPSRAITRLETLAHARPLASEPFLVHGAVALRHGQTERAETLLTEAKKRDPRAPAARYLLADLYLNTGRPVPALAEMAVLRRLLPQSTVQFGRAIAAYARTPGAAEQLATIVRAYPELGPVLLEQLSTDSRNVDLVLTLAGRAPPREPDGSWRENLVRALIADGKYHRAHYVWQQLTGMEVSLGGLFNPNFESSQAPPPFNWRLSNDGGGVAEPRSGGLQVLYYGRADLDLADQTLLLRPGTYRLGMTVSGQVGEAGNVGWTVACLGNGGRLLDLPLPTEVGSHPIAGTFTVPSSECDAQRLALSAKGGEFPERAEFRISGLELERIGAR